MIYRWSTFQDKKLWNITITETVRASATREVDVSSRRFLATIPFYKVQMNIKLFLQICLHCTTPSVELLLLWEVVQFTSRDSSVTFYDVTSRKYAMYSKRVKARKKTLRYYFAPTLTRRCTLPKYNFTMVGSLFCLHYVVIQIKLIN